MSLPRANPRQPPESVRASAGHVAPRPRPSYVAEDIAGREDAGDPWSIHSYGLDVESAQWTLVLKALGALRGEEAPHLDHRVVITWGTPVPLPHGGEPRWPRSGTVLSRSACVPAGRGPKRRWRMARKIPARATLPGPRSKGPGFGMVWGKTLTLRASTWQDGTYQSTVLDERQIP